METNDTNEKFIKLKNACRGLSNVSNSEKVAIVAVQ